MATDPFSALSQGFLQGFQTGQAKQERAKDRELKLQQFAMDKAQNEATLAAQKANLRQAEVGTALKLMNSNLQILKMDGVSDDSKQTAIDGYVNTHNTLNPDNPMPPIKYNSKSQGIKKAVDGFSNLFKNLTDQENPMNLGDAIMEHGKLVTEYSRLLNEENQGLSDIFNRTSETITSLSEQRLGLEDKPKPPTPTDIDDFVEDDTLARGGDKEAKARNDARLKIKRAQSEEIASNRAAGKIVDLEFDPQITHNNKMATRMAEIETEAQLIEAKGERTPVQKKEDASKAVSGKLATMMNMYLKLDTMGQIVNVENSTWDNISASMASSELGQWYGRVTGSDAQSHRNKINSTRPLLMNDIRQASEMGAKGLDSEKELEFYLQAATDPKRDIQAQMAALVVLDRAYGSGETAKLIEERIGPDAIQQIMQEAGTTIETPGTEAQPTEGAKRAPDGNWYVETEPGKFSRVVE